MVLLDSSVWIDHLRRGNSRAAALLGAGDVACHPLVIGELACGAESGQEPVARFRMPA